MMNRCKRPTMYLSFVFTVFAALTLLSPHAQAGWNQIMQENFESHTSADWGNGPWYQPPNGIYSHQWHVVPGQPWQNNIPPHWGIQNRVYRVDPGNPAYIQALWCDASTDQVTGAGRDPNFSTYRNYPSPGPMHTVVYWGPIDCRNIHNLRMQFDWVSNTLPGDTFSWEASSNAGNPIDANWRNHWFRGVYQSGDSMYHDAVCGDFSETWHTSNMKIDSVDSAGTIISLVGRQGVYFGFRFRTTNTQAYSNHLDVKGSFIDNVKVAYDDGLFNLVALGSDYYRASDSLPVPFPQVLDTLIFKFNYSVSGSGIMRDSLGNPVSVGIHCTVNNAPYWDTTVGVNAGEESSNWVLYAPPFIPRIENEYFVRWSIDTTLRESSHADNVAADSFYVIRPNAPPTARFFNLMDADTVRFTRTINSHTLYPVIVNVNDEDDVANWYLEITGDSTLGTGVVITMDPPFPWNSAPDTLTPDTVWVDVGQLSDADWWFQIYATDGLNGPVFARPRACLELNSPASTHDHVSSLPNHTGLYSSYPNPFNAEISFHVGLAEHTNGELRLFDVMGREVDRLAVPGTQPGWYTVHWKPNHVATGVYFAQFAAKGQILSTVKIMYLK